MRGLSGVVSSTVLALVAVTSVSLIMVYAGIAVEAVKREASSWLAGVPPMSLEVVDSNGCEDGIVEAALRVGLRGLGWLAGDVVVLRARDGGVLAAAKLRGGEARVPIPCDDYVVLLIRGPRVWHYSYELDPTKPCLRGYLIRGRDLLEARCDVPALPPLCAWYLDPLLYRATGDPVSYRGYAAAWASAVAVAFAHYGPMYSGGARLTLCDTGVARAPIYILYAAPGELFKTVTGAEPPACLGIVDSMLYVPWINAFVVGVYDDPYDVATLRYYIVYSNGTYIELPREPVRNEYGIAEYVVVNATVGGTRMFIVDWFGERLSATLVGDVLAINYTMVRRDPSTTDHRMVLWSPTHPLIAATNAAPVGPEWAYTATLEGTTALAGESSGGAAAGRALVMEFRKITTAVPALAAYTIDVVVYERCQG